MDGQRPILARSCYQALFLGSTSSPTWQLTWRNWAPLNSKFFIWLASLDRCWTTDRLARHGIQHDPDFSLCSQEPETLHHLLVGCAFSKITWHEILSWCRATVTPPDGSATFFTWWSESIDSSPASLRKGISTIIVLTAWHLWKHRNACVFDGAQPSNTVLSRDIKLEARLWARAGATGLANILRVT
ncbi:uncharacterized protein [Aegilops tauschii subsp. strangulata]|uniref:uncharacterized protein n=1 Tax=Aegilops tauschii subsp. strangulata TaxID=200361 RepID=UPI003CC86879